MSASDSSALQAPEDVLVEPGVQAILCSIRSDERPMKGTAALLDWRLKGLVSRFIKSGQVTGERRELVCIPLRKGSHYKTLLLVGLGKSTEPVLPSENKALLELARAQLLKLKVSRVAVSCSGFAPLEPSDLERALKGLELTWMR